MTAKELIHFMTSIDDSKSNGIPYKVVENLMVEFAKFHVSEALIAASKNAELAVDNRNNIVDYVNENSILKAYPLNNIK